MSAGAGALRLRRLGGCMPRARPGLHDGSTSPLVFTRLPSLLCSNLTDPKNWVQRGASRCTENMRRLGNVTASNWRKSRWGSRRSIGARRSGLCTLAAACLRWLTCVACVSCLSRTAASGSCCSGGTRSWWRRMWAWMQLSVQTAGRRLTGGSRGAASARQTSTMCPRCWQCTGATLRRPAPTQSCTRGGTVRASVRGVFVSSGCGTKRCA